MYIYMYIYTLHRCTYNVLHAHITIDDGGAYQGTQVEAHPAECHGKTSVDRKQTFLRHSSLPHGPSPAGRKYRAATPLSHQRNSPQPGLVWRHHDEESDLYVRRRERD